MRQRATMHFSCFRVDSMHGLRAPQRLHARHDFDRVLLRHLELVLELDLMDLRALRRRRRAQLGVATLKVRKRVTVSPSPNPN